MPEAWVAALAAYFDQAAEAYAEAVEPAYAPLAEIAAKHLNIAPGERVLDLGIGTGLGATAAGKWGAHVIGIDLAAGMLRIAQRRQIANLVRGDLHQMPFQADAFDAALAVFALNSTDPEQVLREVSRVLRPGGRLAAAEWHETDTLSELFSDIFVEYSVDDAPPHLEALREQLEQPIPWDNLETVDELDELVERTGFKDIRLHYEHPKIALSSISAFIQFKMAWPIRAAEFAAMPPDIQRLCMSDLRENIAPHANAAGQVIWEPNILILTAAKPVV